MDYRYSALGALGNLDPKNNGMDIEWLITDLQNIQSTYNGFESVQAFYKDEDAEKERAKEDH